MTALIKPEYTGSYSSQLSLTDRERLRQIVKRVHMRNYPTDMITDYEADKMIDAIGPKVGFQMIQKAMAEKFLV